jgi:hypothetical protein
MYLYLKSVLYCFGFKIIFYLHPVIIDADEEIPFMVHPGTDFGDPDNTRRRKNDK